MLFCSVLAVVVVGIITTMTAKVTNGVGTTAAMMPGDLLAHNGPTAMTAPDKQKPTSAGEWMIRSSQ